MVTQTLWCVREGERGEGEGERQREREREMERERERRGGVQLNRIKSYCDLLRISQRLPTHSSENALGLCACIQYTHTHQQTHAAVGLVLAGNLRARVKQMVGLGSVM